MSRVAHYKHLARLAVEFTYQLWALEDEKLFPRPLSGIYWTIRLGRLALQRDGTWNYWRCCGASSKDEQRVHVRAQRFVHFDEAVRVATFVFGRAPEHAAEMQRVADEFDKP